MPTDEQKLWEVWGQANGLYSSWAASKNINYYLLFVLYALDGQEAVTQKKICICTGLTKQTVNSVVRSLKEDGYIELAPGLEDRREKQIILTEKGIAYWEVTGCSKWLIILHCLILFLRKKWKRTCESVQEHC